MSPSLTNQKEHCPSSLPTPIAPLSSPLQPHVKSEQSLVPWPQFYCHDFLKFSHWHFYNYTQSFSASGLSIELFCSYLLTYLLWLTGLSFHGPTDLAAYYQFMVWHRVHKRIFWGINLYRRCNENYKSHWKIQYLEKCDWTWSFLAMPFIIPGNFNFHYPFQSM